MRQSLQIKPKNPTGWISVLLRKFHWAAAGWNATAASPYINMGGGVVFDLENRRLVLPPNYSIHAQGNLTISCDEHLMFSSGGDPDGRPGYLNSIWFNTRVDESGQPIRDDDPLYIEAEPQEVDRGCSNYPS
jgi:hypothetical protein